MNKYFGKTKSVPFIKLKAANFVCFPVTSDEKTGNYENKSIFNEITFDSA